MSYLAGSQLVESLDEIMSEEQLMEKMEKEGVRLRFGWWDGGTIQSGADTDRTVKNGGCVGVQSFQSDLQETEAVEQRRRFGIDVVSGGM